MALTIPTVELRAPVPICGEIGNGLLPDGTALEVVCHMTKDHEDVSHTQIIDEVAYRWSYA